MKDACAARLKPLSLVAEGEAQQDMTAVDVELAADVGPVVFHRSVVGTSQICIVVRLGYVDLFEGTRVIGEGRLVLVVNELSPA